ncbi:hypothetical protein HK405_002511, partial [Cladochytrium tenue]
MAAEPPPQKPVLPDGHPPVPAGFTSSSCPYSADTDPAIVNPDNRMPPPNQHMAPGQAAPLPTEREVSTIPMAGRHEGKNWIYPSEQV